jgi:DNA polymerase (family 10)
MPGRRGSCGSAGICSDSKAPIRSGSTPTRGRQQFSNRWPEVLFQAVPGVGPRLARVLHEELDVDSFEALEVAAHDGRLDAVPGIGPRRAAAIRAGLAALLARSPRRGPERGPGIRLLLEVDRDYRKLARAGTLPKIAPRRFNPERRTWLPVMHTERDGWHFTVLFSNSARAHQLGRTADWVVIYFYDGEHEEGQQTVVTETHGRDKGRRVVRGREAECARSSNRDAAPAPVRGVRQETSAAASATRHRDL